MLLIYYRDAAGKICDYMRPPADWTLGQVKREIENFNTLHAEGSALTWSLCGKTASPPTCWSGWAREGADA